MTGPAWLNPAGGLRYHLRAFRHAKTLWQPFRWSLGEWLLRWEPPETTLVLVGPSGGYNLQPFLLERFRRVICLEPDPIARVVLSQRLRRAPLDPRPTFEFVSEDKLVHAPQRLRPFLDEIGEAAVLFSNVIGQLRVLLDAPDRDAPALMRVREAVLAGIAGRSFASFHDRVSGAVRPTHEDPVIAERRLSDAELLSEFYEIEASQSSSIEARGLLDHLSGGFFPERREHSYFPWQLEPGVFHLIEAVAGVRESGERTE
jgi:hypothetical protein